MNGETLVAYLAEKFMEHEYEVAVSDIAKHFSTSASKVNRVAERDAFDKVIYTDVFKASGSEFDGTYRERLVNGLRLRDKHLANLMRDYRTGNRTGG